MKRQGFLRGAIAGCGGGIRSVWLMSRVGFLRGAIAGCGRGDQVGVCEPLTSLYHAGAAAILILLSNSSFVNSPASESLSVDIFKASAPSNWQPRASPDEHPDLDREAAWFRTEMPPGETVGWVFNAETGVPAWWQRIKSGGFAVGDRVRVNVRGGEAMLGTIGIMSTCPRVGVGTALKPSFLVDFDDGTWSWYKAVKLTRIR